MSYSQTVGISGSGINFKIGAILRPIEPLRIGLAVHTPTWTSVRHEYQASMRTSFFGESDQSATTMINRWDWSYRTPTRLTAGISYTFGQWAALAFDYERIWYDSISLMERHDTWLVDHYAAEAQELFRPTNNFKAGLEVWALPGLALRAGYAWYGSPLKVDDASYSKPTVTTTQNISAGLGFRLGRNTTLDVAYVNTMQKYAPFDIYYYIGEVMLIDSSTVIVDETDPLAPYGNVSDLKLKRHTIAMSLNFSF
jgi:long-subunit fatty acid transport protein